MSPFLFRLIVAIYILACAPAFVITGGVKAEFSTFVTVATVIGSLVAGPVLLIAWVFGAFSRPKQPWNR